MTTKTAVQNTTKSAEKNTGKVSAEMREKRAQAIAAMNLVTREGDRFKVGTPGLRNRQQFYEVWRNDNAKVQCNCLEFEENAGSDAAFRCEHILAVKHSLLAKTTEAAMKQPAPLKPVMPQVQQTPAEMENATEERAASAPSELEQNDEGKTAENGRTAVREAIAARKALAREAEPQKKPEIVEFADTQDKKEYTMRKVNMNTASFAELEKEQEEYEQDSQPSNIIPMPFTKTLQALRANVEPTNVKQREGWRDGNGNVHMVDYVEWHTVADILDRVAPQWSHTIRDIKQIGDTIAVTAAITVDGVSREGIGTGAADSEMGIKKAEHDALKRAAVKFGIARELYKRESDVIEREGTNQNPNGGGFPSNPVAKSLADLVTPKQLGMIRALGREANVEIDTECETVMSCKSDELSKKAASAFIQHLQDLQSQSSQTQHVERENNYNGLRRVS